MSSRLARPFSFGPLYDLLFEAFPAHRSVQGVLDVKRLAEDCEMTKEGAYKWLRDNKISPAGALKLVEAQRKHIEAGLRVKKRLQISDFIPFVFV